MIQCDDRSFVFNIKCGNEFIDPNLYDVEIYTFNSSSDSNGKVIGTIRGKEYVYQMPTNMEENFVCILVNAKEDILNCKALFDHDHKYSEKFISSGFGSHYRLCECGSKIDYDSHDFEIIYVVDSLNSNKIVVKKHCTLCDTLIDTEDSYTIENSIRSDNCNAKIVLQSAYEFTPKESGEYKFSIKEYDSPYLKFVAVDWLNNLLEVTKENNEFTIFLTKDQQIYFYLELFEHREEVNLHYEHVHTYSDSWSNNSEYHWKTNTCCPSLMSEAEKSEHEYVNMIAEWKNYYPYCGIIYEVCNVCKYQNEFIEQVDARAYTTPLDIGTYVGKKECFVFDTTHHLGDNKTVKLWMVDNKTKEVINPDNYSIVVNDSTLTLIDVSLLEENDQTKGYLFDVNNETNFIFVKYDIQFAATLYIEFVE